MDDPKSLVGLPTSPAGSPPSNLPVVNPSVPPSRPSVPPAPVVPKSPAPSPVPPPAALAPQSPKPPMPSTPALPHSPPQPQGNITLPRSSIRTMENDLKSVQAGQAPKGVEIKPSVLPAERKPVAPLERPKPTPSPLTPPIGVKLGEAEKRTAPLLKPPVLPSSVAKPPVPPTGLAVPPKQSVFANKKILAVGSAIILVLVTGFLYLYLNTGSEPEIVVISPSPSSSPAVSSTLTGSTSFSLAPVFGQPASITIPADSQTQFTVLQNEAVGKSNTFKGQNLLISIKNEVAEYKFSSFLSRFNLNFPANLSSSVDNNDFNLILTKQTEFFDQNGKKIASPSAEDLLKPKIALTVRVVDTLEANQQLTFWEDTIIVDLGEFYDLPPQYGDRHFSDDIYRGIKIRYINFPFPDNSLDYAIITAKNGNDYLIIANSRQQMYSIVDKLLGF